MRSTTVLLLLGLVLSAVEAAAQRDTPSLPEFLRRAGTYVRGFEQQFARFVSEEQSEQIVRRGTTPATLQPGSVERRRLRSEMMFIWLPLERTWLTARNVRYVDGREVHDSAIRLERLLAQPDADTVTQARRLRDESARLNIGPVHRNFTDPMFALLFADPALQSRFTFVDEGAAKHQGVEGRRVGYRERGRPTVVLTDGRDTPAEGELWLDPRDGAVLRTLLRLRDEATGVSVTVDVQFEHHPQFALWLPRELKESYVRYQPTIRTATGTRSVYERVDATATYSNFRKFETGARLLVP